MEIVFQVIDCDYVLVNNLPIVRIFGKTKENKTVCAFYQGFLPYFYVLPKKGMQEEVSKFIQEKFKYLLVKIEKVGKFLPIGYRENKTEFLKIVFKSPPQVAQAREELRKEEFVQEVYEADILFKYRFMADHGVSGMKWVKVVGKATKTLTVKADVTIEVESIQAVEEDSNIFFK